MTNKDEADGTSDSSEFRDRVKFAWGLTAVALLLVALPVVVNIIGDFLHAPIGIKDNPPEPTLVVQYAQLAFVPLAAAFIALSLLKSMSELFSGKQIAAAVACLSVLAVLVVMIVGVILHRDLIPGSLYLWNKFAPFLNYFLNKIGPLLFALLLLLIDLVFAYGYLSDWSRWKTFRERFGTVLIALSSFPAIVTFMTLIGIFFDVKVLEFNDPVSVRAPVIAFVLFFGGIACIPKPTTKHADTVSGEK